MIHALSDRYRNNGCMGAAVPNIRREVHIRPYKNEALIFGAALGFPHYLVHLMSISTILSKIDYYLDMPNRF